MTFTEWLNRNPEKRQQLERLRNVQPRSDSVKKEFEDFRHDCYDEYLRVVGAANVLCVSFQNRVGEWVKHPSPKAVRNGATMWGRVLDYIHLEPEGDSVTGWFAECAELVRWEDSTEPLYIRDGYWYYAPMYERNEFAWGQYAPCFSVDRRLKLGKLIQEKWSQHVQQ